MYKFIKFLNGLKQASKQCHDFKINECDKYIYIKNYEKRYAIVYLYVNDMLIIESNNYMITFIKNLLVSKFDIKDLGVTNVILKIKIESTHEGIVLSQSYYVNKILEKFNKDGDEKISSIDINLHLTRNTGEVVS